MGETVEAVADALELFDALPPAPPPHTTSTSSESINNSALPLPIPSSHRE